MPIVAAALMICEGKDCTSREVVALLRGQNGAPMAEPRPGWTMRQRGLVLPGQAQIVILCSKCEPLKPVPGIVQAMEHGPDCNCAGCPP